LRKDAAENLALQMVKDDAVEESQRLLKVKVEEIEALNDAEESAA
jgi:hypothetical protein